MTAFILILFDRYDADASTHEVVEGESAKDVYAKHIKTILSEDYDEGPEMEKQLKSWVTNAPLKKGRDGLWGVDWEEQSLIILPAPAVDTH